MRSWFARRDASEIADPKTKASAKPSHRTIRRLLYENGLTLVLMGLFLFSWFGQTVTGWQEHNKDNAEHGQPRIRRVLDLGLTHLAG